jgi:hypothetical protein
MHRLMQRLGMLRFGKNLLPEDQRGFTDTGCTRLIEVVRAIFNQGGWRHINRIQDA